MSNLVAGIYDIPLVQKKTKAYGGPTTYQGQEVAQFMTPMYFVNKVLNTNQHTQFTGIAVIGPPGRGKSTLTKTIIHRIHKERPEFSVVWGDKWAFQHQEEFYESLPKKPTIVVFDDSTGYLKEIPDKERQACFSALTRIRHILGLGNPSIVVLVSHYSKNTEKEIRAQFDYKIFCGLGDEEKTNLDQIAPKKSTAYRMLNYYAKVYQDMMEKHEFTLWLSQGKWKTYQTDKPFRVACATTYSSANFILYAREGCHICSPKKIRREIPPETMIGIVKGKYGRFGIQALRLKLYDMGYYDVLPNELTYAKEVVNSICQDMTSDWDKMRVLLNKLAGRTNKRAYRKKKDMERVVTLCRENSVTKDVTATDPEPRITNAMEMFN